MNQCQKVEDFTWGTTGIYSGSVAGIQSFLIKSADDIMLERIANTLEGRGKIQ